MQLDILGQPIEPNIYGNDNPMNETVHKEDYDRYMKQSLKLTWLKATITQEMISSINKEIEENIELALALANGYHINKNADKIVQVLNHINSLKKVLKDYASTT